MLDGDKKCRDASFCRLFCWEAPRWRWETLPAGAAEFPVTKTRAEWQRLLSPEAFRVLRLADTEAPGTSPLLKEKRRGTFALRRPQPPGPLPVHYQL